MEAMSSELMVSALWELDGFLTQNRIPIRVQGGWSDIDVIGVNRKRHVRMAECKVRGSARLVLAIPDGKAFVRFLHKHDWSSSLDNVDRAYSGEMGWLPTKSQTRRFEFWFLANLWFPDQKEQRNAEVVLASYLGKLLGQPMSKKSRARIFTTRDIILEIFQRVENKVLEEGTGKRFGNPILDLFREMVRYLNPQPTGGGQVGTRISEETARLFGKAFLPGI